MRYEQYTTRNIQESLLQAAAQSAHPTHSTEVQWGPMLMATASAKAFPSAELTANMTSIDMKATEGRSSVVLSNTKYDLCDLPSAQHL